MQRLFAGKEFVEIRAFRKKADHLAALHEPAITAENLSASPCRGDQAEYDLQGRTLAGAVWSEQAVNSSGLDFEAQIAHGDDRRSLERNRKNFR